MSRDEPLPTSTADGGTAMMVVGAVAGGVSAYLFHALGGRSLGDGFAPIAVMWTIAFIVVTVLFLPLEQWVTRESARRRNPLSGGRGLLLWVTGLGIASAALAAWWALSPLTGEVGTHIIQMLLLMGGYGSFWIGKGMLQGKGWYGRVGLMLCAEGVVRLVAELVTLSAGGTAVGLGWAMVSAPWVVFFFGFWRGGRSDPPSSPGAVFVWPYVIGAGAAQFLLAAAPLVVTFMGGTAAQVSLIFIVFVLFRAPLTLMYSLQGRILPPLVGMIGRGEGESLRKLAGRLWAGSAGLALLAGLVGYLVGPQVVELLMGSTFAPSASVAALVAVGTVTAAGVQLMAQILVAGSRTRRLATAWVVGLAAAGVVVWLAPAGPVMAVAIGFVAGEATALTTVGIMALSRSRVQIEG